MSTILSGPEVFERCDALILDHDDTITSSYPYGMEYGGIHEMSRLAAIQRLGREIGVEALVEYPEELNNTSYNREHQATFQAAVWVNLMDAGLVLSIADFDPNHPLVARVVAYKEEVHPSLIKLHAKEVPGAAKFISSFVSAGKHVAIASSAHRPEIEHSLITIGLNHFFDCSDGGNVIGYEDVPHGMHKPHAEHYIRAIRKLPHMRKGGLIIAIDDHPGGIESAVKAGCYTLGITTRKVKQELLSTSVPPDQAGTYADFGRWLELPGYVTDAVKI